MTDPKDHPQDPLPPPNRLEPAADAAPYELAPEPPPVPSAPPCMEPARAGKLSDKGLTDDFDEDTDFDTDPEVERALKGGPVPDADSSNGAEVVDTRPVLVKATGDAQILAIVGGGLAVAAAVVTGFRNQDHWFSAGLLALYMALLNTVTGAAAIGVVAYFERARLGKLDQALARMLIAVAAGSLVISIGVGGYNVITAPLGIAVYIGLLAALFRWVPPRLVRVAAVHALFLAAIYIAMMLHAAASAGNSP